MDRMQALLMSKYELREIGELTEYLGLLNIRDRVQGTLCHSQRTYSGEILSRYTYMEGDRVQGTVYHSQRTYSGKILSRLHMEDCVALQAPSTGADRLLPNISQATAGQRQSISSLRRLTPAPLTLSRPSLTLLNVAPDWGNSHIIPVRNIKAAFVMFSCTNLKGTLDLGTHFLALPLLGLRFTR